MMAAAMPLVILYEMSIWMSIYVSKKIEKQEKGEAKSNLIPLNFLSNHSEENLVKEKIKMKFLDKNSLRKP
jgi:hypothetical protein